MPLLFSLALFMAGNLNGEPILIFAVEELSSLGLSCIHLTFSC